VEKGKRKAETAAESIIVKGARTHNLKNISVEMPRNAMICDHWYVGVGEEFVGLRYDIC